MLNLLRLGTSYFVALSFQFTISRNSETHFSSLTDLFLEKHREIACFIFSISFLCGSLFLCYYHDRLPSLSCSNKMITLVVFSFHDYFHISLASQMLEYPIKDYFDVNNMFCVDHHFLCICICIHLADHCFKSS